MTILSQHYETYNVWPICICYHWKPQIAYAGSGQSITFQHTSKRNRDRSDGYSSWQKTRTTWQQFGLNRMLGNRKHSVHITCRIYTACIRGTMYTAKEPLAVACVLYKLHVRLPISLVVSPVIRARMFWSPFNVQARQWSAWETWDCHCHTGSTIAIDVMNHWHRCGESIATDSTPSVSDTLCFVASPQEILRFGLQCQSRVFLSV